MWSHCGHIFRNLSLICESRRIDIIMLVSNRTSPHVRVTNESETRHADKVLAPCFHASDKIFVNAPNWGGRGDAGIVLRLFDNKSEI